MIKLIGAVMIVAGTAFCGVKSIIKMRERVKSLSALIHSLDIMRSEICDRMTPMTEIIRLLKKETAFPANVFYKNLDCRLEKLGQVQLSELWNETLSSTPQLMLAPQESDILCELGASLGRYSVYEQEKALFYAKKRLEARLKRAELEREKDSKVQAFLGVAAGIFAVIIFL